jgi:hypothetical protein
MGDLAEPAKEAELALAGVLTSQIVTRPLSWTDIRSGVCRRSSPSLDRHSNLHGCGNKRATD